MIESLVPSASMTELKRIELRSRRSLNTSVIGQYRSAFRGSGLVFSDIREYLPGDDVKHIHWKVTARSGKVYIKSYEEDRELNIVVVMDISCSTTAGSIKSKYRRGIEFCGLLCMLSKINQDSLGLCLFSDEVELYLPVSKSRNQFKRVILELLQERPHKPTTDIGAALIYLSQNLKRSSVIFVISDFYSKEYSEELRLLSYKHDVIAVMLEDNLDFDLPSAGIVEFRDAESGEYILLDTSNKRTKEKLRLAHENRVQNWKEICKTANCDFLEIKNNPLGSLSKLMAKRDQRLR